MKLFLFFSIVLQDKAVANIVQDHLEDVNHEGRFETIEVKVEAGCDHLSVTLVMRIGFVRRHTKLQFCTVSIQDGLA